MKHSNTYLQKEASTMKKTSLKKLNNNFTQNTRLKGWISRKKYRLISKAAFSGNAPNTFGSGFADGVIIMTPNTNEFWLGWKHGRTPPQALP